MYGADTKARKNTHATQIKMQCNNNLFRFIYSFNVRARKKNSQSKIHKCNFFSGEEGRIVDLQSFWVLRVFTYLFCNIGRFVGLPFLSNLEVFCIFKISHFQKLLLAFFVNSLRKSIGGFDHRLTIWERKLRKEIWMIFKKNFQKMPHKK